MLNQGQKQVFHGNVLVAHGLGLVLRIDQHLIQVVADVELAASADLGQLLQRLFHLIFQHIALNPHLGHQF